MNVDLNLNLEIKLNFDLPEATATTAEFKLEIPTAWTKRKDCNSVLQDLTWLVVYRYRACIQGSPNSDTWVEEL